MFQREKYRYLDRHEEEDLDRCQDCGTKTPALIEALDRVRKLEDE